MAAKSKRGAGEASKSAAGKGTAAKPTPGKKPFTLCVDIGGTGLKTIVLDATGAPQNERTRTPTPRPATPKAILATLATMLKEAPAFDRVSVGFPGVVRESVVFTAPNLDRGWAEFPLGKELEQLTGKPTRVLNDAGVQGYGVIAGKGVEQILTLGTGMGHALYINGKYVPNIELAHHPFHKSKTYEEFISNAVLEKIGKKQWRKRVYEVIHTVLPIFNPDTLYLGGGNARHLKEKLPANVKVVENIAGLLGGIALWAKE
jgi:polyphosphate glucokinase